MKRLCELLGFPIPRGHTNSATFPELTAGQLNEARIFFHKLEEDLDCGDDLLRPTHLYQSIVLNSANLCNFCGEVLLSTSIKLSFNFNFATKYSGVFNANHLSSTKKL